LPLRVHSLYLGNVLASQQQSVLYIGYIYKLIIHTLIIIGQIVSLPKHYYHTQKLYVDVDVAE